MPRVAAQCDHFAELHPLIRIGPRSDVARSALPIIWASAPDRTTTPTDGPGVPVANPKDKAPT